MREALRCVLLFLCGAICYLNAHSQSVVNDSQLISGVFTFPYREYGSGVSFFDCNNDGRDDITFPLKNDSIIVFLNNGDGFTPFKFNYIFGEAKQPLWADFDNDGDNDLLVTVYDGQTRLLRNNGDFEFEDITLEAGLSITNGYLTYGASWGDYNNDGWLDLYINVYDFGNAVGNFLLKNNQGINFSNVTSVTGATINSDYSFQSSMIDFDFDGDIDIHVANDRYPRDGFYVNQGNFFQNLYSFYGLDRNSDSMSSSWADYDHDGDMDFYVSNTALMGNDFWEMNNEGFFSDVAEEKGVEVFRWCWGALWVDIDNNTWEDLYVCNQANPDDVPPFFINNEGTFTQNNIIENASESDVVWSYSAAKGDFNNDGFYDIAINTYNGAEPRLYRNQSDQGKWVKVKLEGTISNRDAFGARIEYWLGDRKLIRHHLAGTNYLSQDSQWLILGLGEATNIDSLIIYWPGSSSQTFYNIPAGTVTHLVEGNGFVSIVDDLGSPINTLYQTICEGQTLTLSAQGYANYLWSDGTVGSEINISEQGQYYVTAWNNDSDATISTTIDVQIENNLSVVYSLTDVICFGQENGSFNVEAINGNSGDVTTIVTDEFGLEMSNLQALSSGNYNVLIEDEAGCQLYSQIEISEPEELTLEIVQISQNLYQANALGGTPPYNVFLNGESIEIGIPISFTEEINQVLITDTNGCTANDVVVISSVASTAPQKSILISEGFIIYTGVDFPNISISDVCGRNVFNGKYSNPISQEKWSSGIYLLQFSNNGEYTSLKFFVP